jgi:hypothetical protein
MNNQQNYSQTKYDSIKFVAENAWKYQNRFQNDWHQNDKRTWKWVVDYLSTNHSRNWSDSKPDCYKDSRDQEKCK